MAANGNRMPLVCNFCMKITDRLATHLRRVCRKEANDAEIMSLVTDAKNNARRLLTNISVVNYKVLEGGMKSAESLSFIINFLESSGVAIMDKPLETESSQIQGEASEDPEVNEEERTVCRMKEMKATEKHSVHSPLLVGFSECLDHRYSKTVTKIDVNNVARFLYFMDAHQVSASVLHNYEKIEEFLDISRFTSGTRRNYISSIKKFVQYVAAQESLIDREPSLRGSAERCLKGLEKMQKSGNTNVSPLICRKAENPEDCLEALRIAREYFLELIDRANSGLDLEERDRLAVLHFLESVLIVAHMHRPSLIQNMTVKQWMDKKYRMCQEGEDTTRVVVIKVEVGDTEQMVVLQETEEMWLDTFFCRIRPIFLKKSGKGSNNFFLNSKGEPVINPSSDIKRFQQRFNACPVTGQEARNIFKQVILPTCPQEEQRLLQDYLDSKMKPTTKEKLSEFLQAALLVPKLQYTWTSSPTSRDTQSDQDSEPGCAPTKEREIAFKDLLDKFPVELDPTGPTLKDCERITGIHGKYCYDRWRRQQYKLRQDDVIGQFKTNRPTLQQVSNYIKRQGWQKNYPAATDIFHYWKPKIHQGKMDADRELKNRIDSQIWQGLSIVSDPRTGGEKLVTQQPFRKGDVVCDYHGPLISAKKGQEMMRTMKDDMGYLFFFKDRENKHLCVDAQNVPCDCHPHMTTTFGRKINHSRKNPNIKPTVKYFEGDKKPYIIFKALKDIPAGKELFFDYGITRKSFGQEGAGLSWLDD